jgi:hypothetical protein
MLIRLPYVIDLIKQTKKPERNLLAKTNIDTIAYYLTIFNTLYLFESLALSSHFEEPFAIH